VTLRSSDANKTALGPMHPGELPRWLLKRIIKVPGLDDLLPR
jgi:hypothetical protein